MPTLLPATHLQTMLPFKRPPTLLPHCTQCFHRTISTSATATRKRRRIRHALKTVDQDLQERASILRTRIQEARVARREDWILGPLAPKRDTGDGEYGAVTVRDLKGAKWGLGRGVLSERHRGGVSAMGKKKKKKQGEIGTGMSWKESLIYVGDRVGIVSDSGPEGRDLGKIGVVAEVRRGRREVVVEGLNMVCFCSQALLFETGRVCHRSMAMNAGCCRCLRSNYLRLRSSPSSSSSTSIYDESC